MIGINNAYCMDTFEGMSLITERVDLILCDLPYGRTQNKWDSILDLKLLWKHYERLIKPNGAIILTAQTPFDKLLGCSKLEWLRYEWIWEKTKATGHLNAKKAPMKAHENILIFYKKQPTYHPQKTTGHKPVNKYTKHQTDGSNYGKTKVGVSGGGNTDRYPRSVLRFAADKEKIHPTQKPVELFRYLIRTYSNPGELILDNCIGSGTTAVAAELEGRNWIGFDNDQHWINVTNQRLENIRNEV